MLMALLQVKQTPHINLGKFYLIEYGYMEHTQKLMFIKNLKSYDVNNCAVISRSGRAEHMTGENKP